MKTAAKEFNRQMDKAVHEFFAKYATQLEKGSPAGDISGFCRRIKGLDVEEKRPFASQIIEDEDGKLLRDPVLIS